MRRFKIISVLSLPLSLFMVVGCSTPEYEAEQARQAALEQEQEQALAGPQLNKRPGKALRKALAQLDLRPEQRRELDTLHAGILEQMATLAGQHAGLAQEFGTAIRSGAVDLAQLRTSLTTFIRSAQGMKPMMIKTINQGHALLDPAQRTKLVQLLKAHHQEHAKTCRGAERFKRLGAKLGISEQQRQQLKQLVLANMTAEERTRMQQRRQSRRQRHLAALEAFKSDDFDAAKLPAFNRPPHDRLKAERVARVLNLALPMLKAEQRVLLAKSIELRSANFIAELKKESAALKR